MLQGRAGRSKVWGRAAVLIAIQSCSIPVNIIESKSIKIAETNEPAPADPKARFLRAVHPSASEEPRSDFRTYARECNTCNGHALILIGEPGEKLQNYSAFLKSMLDSGFAVIAVESSAASDDEASCRLQYSEDMDRLDRCLTIARNDRVMGVSKDGQTTIGLVKTVEDAIKLLAASSSNWERFLNAERNFFWSSSVIVGMGKSAAVALKLAQKRKVSRLCSFHGPTEFTSGSHIASWLSSPSLTPANRMYFMTHKHDGGRDALQKMDLVLKRIGVESAPKSWTRPSEQLLFASLQGESCTDTSRCLIHDPIPVDGNGEPIYTEAWKYLCLPGK